MAKKICDAKDQLRVLRLASRRGLPARITRKSPDLLIYAELVDSGHLDGWVTLGSDSQPVTVLNAAITPLGWEYLDEFEEIHVPTHLASRPSSRLRRLPAAQWFRGLGAFVVLVTILFLACKYEDSGRGNEGDSAAHKQTGRSSPMFYGVCGMPPVP